MSRPRKGSENVIISIAMPVEMTKRLNLQLSYKASRSAWIRNAIMMKLDGGDDLHLHAIDTQIILQHLRYDVFKDDLLAKEALNILERQLSTS
jgi:predicted DNA-binding protein